MMRELKIAKSLGLVLALGIFSACESPFQKKKSEDAVALKVEPGQEIMFVPGTLFFGATPTFSSAEFKIYRNGKYQADAFSRTIVSQTSVVQKYSKQETPSELDYVKIKVRFPSGEEDYLTAFLTALPTQVDFASTMAVKFFFETLKRPPNNAQEVQKIVRIFTEGLQASCFDSDVQMPNRDTQIRVARNALMDHPPFVALRTEYGISQSDINMLVGSNRPPEVTSMSPLPRLDILTYVNVLENQVRNFASQSRDLDNDLFTAHWYLNSKRVNPSSLTFDEKATVDRKLWYPLNYAYRTSFEDSAIGTSKVDQLEFRLCDGGRAQRYMMQVTVGDLNRPPLVFTNPPEGQEIPEFDRTAPNTSTTVVKIQAKDPDGDRLYVRPDDISDQNVILSLSPDPSMGVPLTGDWMQLAYTDKSASDPKGWLPSQIFQNKAPSYISFNEATMQAVLENFPATGQTASVAFERFVPLQNDLVGVRFKQVSIKHPVNHSPVDLACTLTFSFAGRRFELICSQSHETLNSTDFEFRASYGCPKIEDLTSSARNNPICTSVPANIVNSDGSSDPSKITKDTIYEAYIIVRPSDKQARNGKISTGLIFTDQRENGEGVFRYRYDVSNINRNPFFTKIKYVNKLYPFTLEEAEAQGTKMPNWQRSFSLFKPSDYFGEIPLNQWSIGTPIYNYVSGSNKQVWMENFEWRRQPGSPTNSNDLFASNVVFRLDSTLRDGQFSRIRFGLYSGSTFVETIRKIALYGEEGNNVYFRILNFYDAGSSNFNGDAVCRASTWFTRNPADYGGLPINDPSYQSQPIHNDVKIVCAPAQDAVCPRVGGSLACAKAHPNLGDAELNASGQQYDIAIERLLFRPKVPTAKMATTFWDQYWDISSRNLSNSNYFDQTKLNENQLDDWHRRVASQFQTVLFDKDAEWLAGTKFREITDTEQVLRARLQYFTSPVGWPPTANPNYGDVYINQARKTIRWHTDFEWRKAQGAGIPAWERDSYRFIPPGMGCSYTVRDKGQSLNMTCSRYTVANQSAVPKNFSNFISFVASENLTRNSLVVVGGRAVVVTANVSTGQTGLASASGQVTVAKQAGVNMPFQTRVYWHPTLKRMQVNTTGGAVHAGWVAEAASAGAATVKVHIQHESTPVIVKQWQLYPAWESVNTFSEGQSILFRAGDSIQVQLKNVESGPDKLELENPSPGEYRIKDSREKLVGVLGDWLFNVVWGQAEDADYSPAGTSDEIKFKLDLGANQRMDAFLIYRNKEGRFVVDKHMKCYEWWDPFEDPNNPIFNQYGLDKLQYGEFALMYKLNPWCDTGMVPVGIPDIAIKVEDAVGATSRLRIDPDTFAPPQPPYFYAWGNGSYKSGDQFNDKGCTNLSYESQQAGYEDIWTPQDLYLDENMKALKKTDFNGRERSFVRYGSYEVYGALKRAIAHPDGGSGQGGWSFDNWDCTINAYHPYGQAMSLSFVKKTPDGTPENLKFQDPTANGSIPGISLGDFISDPELTSIVTATDPATLSTHSIFNWTHTPKPSNFPNFFSPWVSTSGVVGNAGTTRADLSDYKTLLFRNAYAIAGMNKFFLIMAKGPNTKVEDVVCPQDIAYLSTLTSTEHLPGGVPASANALCYELNPQDGSLWQRPDTEGPDGAYDLVFKVFGLEDLAVSGNTGDMTCKASIQYGDMNATSILNMDCINDPNSISISFHNAKSRDQDLLKTLMSNLASSSFRLIPYEEWGYFYTRVAWGDFSIKPEGMEAYEAPGRWSAVLAADDGNARTLLPIRFLVRDQKNEPLINTSEFALNDFVAELSEGESRSQTDIEIFTDDAGIVPLVKFEPFGGMITAPNLDLSGQFSQTLARESDAVVQEFSPSATFLSYVDAGQSWVKPKFVMTKRETASATASSSAYAKTAYRAEYTSPKFKYEHQSKYPWGLNFKMSYELQYPMEFYTTAANQLAPDILWDHDKLASTPLEVLIPRASAFDGSSGGAFRFAPTNSFAFPLIHHESNKAPCMVAASMRGSSAGTVCPDVTARGSAPGQWNSGFDGLHFNHSGGRLIASVNRSRKLVASNPATGVIDSVATEHIFEGERLRAQIAIHDPNWSEGIEVAPPAILQQPHIDNRFGELSSITISLLTKGVSEPKLPGVTTSFPASGSASQTEYAINWKMQDIHVGKIVEIDGDDTSAYATPVPRAEMIIQDQGTFPKKEQELVDLKFYGWDVNNDPKYLGVVWSNLSEYTNTEMKYPIEKEGDEPFFHEVIFAAYDLDRGDDLMFDIVGPESSGLILNDTIKYQSFSGPTVVRGKTCRDHVEDMGSSLHPAQPVACLQIQFRVLDPLMTNLGFNLLLKDIPWWQRTVSNGGPFPDTALAFNPNTYAYDIPIANYFNVHPKNTLIDSSETYLTYYGQVGGTGFLIPAKPMPIAYIGEVYTQDFIFFTPEKKSVECTLNKAPKLPDFTLNVLMPSRNETLDSQEVMQVSKIFTPNPRFVVCRLTWRPIIRYWITNNDLMDVEVRFFEDGLQKGTVAYELNPDAGSDPFDSEAFRPTPDGVRTIEDTVRYDYELRPNLDLAAISISASGSSTAANGDFSAPENRVWNFSYNKNAVDRDIGYPSYTIWYFDDVPVATNKASVDRSIGPTEAGRHKVALYLSDGGNRIKYIERYYYVRNSSLGVAGAGDGLGIAIPQYDPDQDSLSFFGLVGNFSGDKAILATGVNLNRMVATVTHFNDDPAIGHSENSLVSMFQQKSMAFVQNIVGTLPGVAFTNTGGPSRLNGQFAVDGYHSPLYLALEDDGVLRDREPASSVEMAGLFNNRFENTGGLSKNDSVSVFGTDITFALTNDGISTLRSSRNLWIHNQGNNSVRGYLGFGTASAEQILDFRYIRTNTKSFVLGLTSSGLYAKEITGATGWYNTWVEADGYSPGAKTSGLLTLVDFSTQPIDGGRILIDEVSRFEGLSSLRVLLWTGKENEAAQLRSFLLGSNASVSSLTTVNNFPINPSSLGGTAWPRHEFSFISDQAQVAHFLKPQSALIVSVDLSNPALPQSTFSLPGAELQALSCHRSSERCFVFDKKGIRVWRLK